MSIPSVRLRNFKGNVSDIADYLIDNEASPYSLNVCNDGGPLGPLPGFTRVSATPLTPANKDFQYAYAYGNQYRYNGGLQVNVGTAVSNTNLAFWANLDAAGATETDQSGNSNTLTKNGTITAVAGAIGNGSKLTNTSAFWRAADSSSLSTTGGDISAGIWVNLPIVTGQSRVIMGKNTWFTMFVNTSGFLQVKIGATTATADTTQLAAGTLYHVAFVFDNTANTISYYINSALSSTVSSFTDTPTDNASSLSIGIDDTFGVSAMNGASGLNNVFDEPFIFTRTLTAAELVTIKTYGMAAALSGGWATVTSLTIPSAPTVATYTVRTMATTSSTCSAVANSEFFDNVADEGTYAFFQTYFIPSLGIESAPSAIASVTTAHSCAVTGGAGTWTYQGCTLTPSGVNYDWGADCVIKLYSPQGYFGTALDSTALNLSSLPNKGTEFPKVFIPKAPPTGNAIFGYKESVFIVTDASVYYSCFRTNRGNVMSFSDNYRIDLDISDDDGSSALIGGIGTAQFGVIYSNRKTWLFTGDKWSSFKNTDTLLTASSGGVNKYAVVMDKKGSVYLFGGDSGITRIKQDFSIENIAIPIMDVLLGENSLLTLDPSAYSDARTLYDPRRNWVWFFVRKSGSSENDVAIIWDATNEQWYFKDRIPGRAAWSDVDADGQVSLYTIDAAGYQYQISDNAWLDYSMGGTNTGSPTSSVGSGATTITDTGASFTTTGQSLKDAYIILIEGTTIVKAVIASNTSTVITLTGAIGTAFTTAAVYYIGWQDCQWRSKMFDNDTADLKEVVRNIAIDTVKAASAQIMYVDIYTDYSNTARQTTKALALGTYETPQIVSVNQRFNYLQIRLRSITSTRNPLIREIAIPIQQRDRI